MKKRGVAQLIARRIWDAEAASLSLATPTIKIECTRPIEGQTVTRFFCLRFVFGVYCQNGIASLCETTILLRSVENLTASFTLIPDETA